MNPVFQEFHNLLDTIIKSKEYYTCEAFESFPYSVVGLYLDKSGPRIWYLNSAFLNLVGDPKATIKTGISTSRFFRTFNKKSMEEAGLLEPNKCVTFDSILTVKNNGIIEVHVTGKTFMIEGQNLPHFLGAIFQPKDLEVNEEKTLQAVRKFSETPQFGSADIVNAAQVIKENVETLRQTTLKWSERFKEVSEPDFDAEEDANARP